MYLTRSTQMSYDGDGDHKDKAETYAYSTGTGNLQQKVEWGEVTGSDDGSFSDTGTDKFTTSLTYAASTTAYLPGLPSRETVDDYASTTLKDTKFYFDSQTLGTATAGNETKREMLKSGSSYASTTRAYNIYGLLTQETDPRGKTTSCTYDSYNLRVATSTNALNQSTGYVYRYSIGKPKRTNAPNNLIFETAFDPLDRVTQQNQPDLTTPSTLVTKTAYTYTDTIGSRKVQETNYLSSATSTDRYTYLDGLDRPIQERTEAEGSNYAVKDFQYNKAEIPT